MITYQEIIAEARQFANDALEPYRDSDAVYLQHLNRGLVEIARIRPDAYFSLYSGNEINPPVVIGSGFPDYLNNEVTLGAEISFDAQFYPQLIAYIVGMIELKEDEFTVDGRALMMLTGFRNALLGAA